MMTGETLSKITIIFGVLSINIVGTIHTTVLPYHFQTSYVKLLIKEKEPYWFWVTVSKVKLGTVHKTLKIVDERRRNSTDFGSCRQRLNLAQSIKPCGHDTDYRFCPITFKLNIMRGRILLILGRRSKVKVKICTLSIKPSGHDTDNSFGPITFNLHI